MRPLHLVAAVALVVAYSGVLVLAYSAYWCMRFGCSDPERNEAAKQAADLEQLRKDWQNRFWEFEQPSELTPDKVHGGEGPGF